MSLPFLFSLTANPISILLKQIAIAWKRVVWSLGLWDSVREFARMYDAGMGVLIFVPIAFLSWFPFVSTFQSRLLFNQAFSRGLEISLILAGNKANVEIWFFTVLDGWCGPVEIVDRRWVIFCMIPRSS